MTAAEVVELTPEAPAHLTKQSAAAWHFAKTAGDRVRYDHGRSRWLIWAGHRWQPDEDGTIRRLWLDVLADRYRLALRADDRQHALAEVQTAGATDGAVTGGLQLASNFRPIATRAGAWDPNAWLVGCENGVVDLRTGELRDGRPEDMISRSTLVNFDPAAECPRWTRFLTEVFAGDEELITWFARLAGSMLIGLSFELLAVWHGLGNNGKSVAIKSCRRAFGDYAVTIPIETLINAKRSAGAATPDLMVLRGARVAFAAEPSKAAKLAGGTLKRLASVDQISGRTLYADQAAWNPTHSLVLATNHLPTADDVTDSFWRRIALVPWTTRFGKPGENGVRPEDPNLSETLAGEAAGILAWAVRGAVALAGGASLWPFPASVQAKTAAYRANEDRLGAFAESHVVYEKDADVTLNALFAAYERWCNEEDVPLDERFRSRAFSTEFEERGRVQRYRDGHNWPHFRGARLASESELTNSRPDSRNPPASGEIWKECEMPSELVSSDDETPEETT